jgi:hydroxyacylglutathione hydrolase
MTPSRAQMPLGCTPQIVVLEMYFQFMKNYSYLVSDPAEHEAVIVDPAWQMEKVERALAGTPAKLRGVLITHSHYDHIHLASQIADTYKCPIWMSAAEISFSGFSSPRLKAIDSEPWEVGHLRIEPLLTPGHTPGSTCYLIGDCLFSGDVLFAEGCGICVDMEAAYAMFSSLEKLKTRIPLETRIFPGHAYQRTPGQLMAQVLKDNMYLQFSNKHSFAAFRLRSGQNQAKMFQFI